MRLEPRVFFFLFALVLVAARDGVFALEDGIFDCAREGDPTSPCLPAGTDTRGCGSCHGGLLPQNTTTTVTLDGLPEGGWIAGETYDLSVSVVGPHIPVPDGCPGVGPFPALTNLAGFNLEASAGEMSPIGFDATVRVRNDTECDRVRRITGCGNPYMPPCPTDCDDTTIVSAQATHSIAGNSQQGWAVRWTAPAAGTGEVRFHLAGNSVNGNCRPDAGDLYTILPLRTVPEGD